MVEWKKLGDIMQIVRGASPRPIQNYITSNEDGVNWIKIGDVSPNDKYITKTNEKITKDGAKKSRYLHPGDFILSNSMSFGRPYILKTDGCIHDGWIAMSDYEKSLVSGYLYEVLNSNFVQDYWKQKANNGGAMSNLNSDIVKATIIPVPSLSEQERIVGILDTFTSSIDNLKQQIAQRRKQYEYYRDQLLDLEGKEGVEMKTLGNIGEICMCKRIMKEQTSDNDDIPFFKIGTFGGIADAFISRELFEDYKSKYSYPKKGEILISAAGTIGRSVVFDGKDAYFQDSNIVWLANNEKVVTNRYLYYFYQIADWKTDGGTIKRLYNYNLKNTKIPIPSLSEQQRIVSILDTFEASIQNLEAQLSQREKQYEYYRNKLLTFE
jgi:type I restriction enzyme S subunit